MPNPPKLAERAEAGRADARIVGTWPSEPIAALPFTGFRAYLARMEDPSAPRPTKSSVLGTVVLVVVLFGLLIAAILFAVRSWTSIEGPPLPEVGYIAMTIGVVFSLLIGVALMALLFYSSRHGYDERASRDTRADSDPEP
jgi:hypothetical protein